MDMDIDDESGELAFLQAYMEIKCPGGSESAGPKPTHDEINATAFLSVVASLTPWSDHNQSPRNMYQCQVMTGPRSQLCLPALKWNHSFLS
jgi:DNA-directed RNA polymerase beta subunit